MGIFCFAPAVRVIPKDDDVGVLSAEFDHGIDFRVPTLDRKRDCVYFLHKLGPDEAGRRVSAGPSDKNPGIVGTDVGFFLHATQEVQQHLGLTSVVSLIIAPNNMAFPALNYGCFHSR